MKHSYTKAPLAVLIAAMLSGCSPHESTVEVLRPVRTVELRYDKAVQVNRYVGTVQARHEVDQAFRVGGKVVGRKVEVGQTVREGDVIAVLDDTDYRLAEQAARQAFTAATTQARQAASDRQRLDALKSDGSVSASDDERSQTGERTAQAAAEAEAKKLELARNRLKYTVLRAPQSGVVTAVRFEVGQVVAEGQPVVSIANQGEPEIVVDVPEDHLQSFKSARFKAILTSAPEEAFDVLLRELAPQAAAQTRTFRARLKPATARLLPLGATATLTAQRVGGETPVAAIPASAITQANGHAAVWSVRRAGAESIGTVELVPVEVHGYRNDEVLVSGPAAGESIVTAGVQKMSPSLHVALPESMAGATSKQAAR